MGLAVVIHCGISGKRNTRIVVFLEQTSVWPSSAQKADRLFSKQPCQMVDGTNCIGVLMADVIGRVVGYELPGSACKRFKCIFCKAYAGPC